MSTAWRVHASAITFTQAFPDGANGTALPQSPPWKPGDIALTDDISQPATAIGGAFNFPVRVTSAHDFSL